MSRNQKLLTSSICQSTLNSKMRRKQSSDHRATACQSSSKKSVGFSSIPNSPHRKRLQVHLQMETKPPWWWSIYGPLSTPRLRPSFEAKFSRPEIQARPSADLNTQTSKILSSRTCFNLTNNINVYHPHSFLIPGCHWAPGRLAARPNVNDHCY